MYLFQIFLFYILYFYLIASLKILWKLGFLMIRRLENSKIVRLEDSKIQTEQFGDLQPCELKDPEFVRLIEKWCIQK